MIEKLNWDSDFFGYPVGRIMVVDENGLLQEDISEINNFKLVYLFSEYKLNINHHHILEVDIKTTLNKSIIESDIYPIHPSISEYKGGQDATLESLALESGVYSRFKIDPSFVNNEYTRLYTKWIDDSITKKIADKVIVYLDNNIIEGFVSLKFKKTYAEVGLIAVNSNSRGKGVGSQLLIAAFNFAQNKGLSSTKIVTQFANIPAMKLYQKVGFEMEKQLFIYHIWN